MVNAAVPRKPRAVVLVGNSAAPYSRGLRIARTLVSAGYAVEIAAVAAPGLLDRESGEGWILRRYAPSGPWARAGRSQAGDGTAQADATPSLARRSTRFAAALRRWIFWPHTVRGWWATLDRDLEPADLYHACGSLTIAAALRARDRTPIGPSGRATVVVYDAIDDVFESNNVLDMPRPIRSWHAHRETRWARSADAVVTVNEPLAERLGARWGRALTAVPNYPETIAGDAFAAPPGADLIRREIGLPATTRIVLFQGRLGPRLGLDEAAEAVLRVPDAALVLLGFGRWFERERARDEDPRFAGRHFTLAARHPDELLAWTAGADAAIVPLPPVSINQRLSSPNKFWEALAAGTPVVVPAGLTFMADIVRTDDLGSVSRSGNADDLAGALAAILDVSADVASRRRARITMIARERFSWATAAGTYRAVVDGVSAAGRPRAADRPRVG
jgi:Glycosyltransferase